MTYVRTIPVLVLDQKTKVNTIVYGHKSDRAFINSVFSSAWNTAVFWSFRSTISNSLGRMDLHVNDHLFWMLYNYWLD